MSTRLSDNRSPAVAGLFYSAEPETLRNDVRHFLSAAKPRVLAGELQAVLVPHAGHEYSGPVAAEAFRQLAEGWDTAVMLGPAHRQAVAGASVWASGSFSTPLGAVPVDEDLARSLLESSALFEDSRAPHQAEHSLEVELPFLQETLKSFRIVPILMNTDDPNVCREIGRAIARIVRGPDSGRNDKKRVLLVISSDLSHYPDRETARRTDYTSLLALKRMDPEFLKLTSEILLERGDPELHCTYCGQAALLAGLEAVKALGADCVEILKYANSADVPKGDPNRVVGYAAAAFVRSGSGAIAPSRRLVSREDDKISPEAAQQLLQAARTSIEEAMLKKPLRVLALSDHPELNLPLNVFVTLWLDGELQGCLGSIEPRETLLEAVRRLARDAAFDDPRGKPLSPVEAGRLKIEISILSAFQRVPDAAPLEIGKHGVMLSKGSRRGLFLPDVWENFTRREDFLDALCQQKMGLPRRSWQDRDMVFETFTTQKIQ